MTLRQRWAYWSISTVLATAWISFLIYWLNIERRPTNFAADGLPNVFDIALFVGLTCVLLLPVTMLTLGWIVTGLQMRAKAVVVPTELPDPLTTRVAFITTYVPGSEPIDMLSRTLCALRDVDYPHDTWVLDEGNDGEVKSLCEIIGVRYFSRSGVSRYNKIGSMFSPRSKGGNHNAWYDSHGVTDYDIVAQIDTDFIPRRDFLTKTLPYFLDPDVAFVGTPQVYDNMDNFVARGAAEQTYGFYGAFLRGLSSIDSTMLIGANHVIRVAALKDVGLYNPHLTEDLATGIILHSKGWKSKYVAEALALGEGPDTWSAFFKQQFRWAKGCNDLLFTRTFGAIKGMKPLQGVIYTWLQMYYLSGATYGIALALLGLYFCFGWNAASVELLPFVSVYLPLLAVFELAMFWTQRFNIRPSVERGWYIHGRILMIAVMPVFLAAFISAIKDRNKHTEFEVTPKGGTATIKKGKKGKNPYKAHMAVVTYTLLTLLVGILSNRVGLINVGWIVITLLSAAAIAINPSWPSIKLYASAHSRKQLKAIKQFDHEFDKQLDDLIVSSKKWAGHENYDDKLSKLHEDIKRDLDFHRLIKLPGGVTL